jgi:uncharacterized protein involved in exopolysaccharide biosynthesis
MIDDHADQHDPTDDRPPRPRPRVRPVRRLLAAVIVSAVVGAALFGLLAATAPRFLASAVLEVLPPHSLSGPPGSMGAGWRDEIVLDAETQANVITSVRVLSPPEAPEGAVFPEPGPVIGGTVVAGVGGALLLTLAGAVRRAAPGPEPPGDPEAPGNEDRSTT